MSKPKATPKSKPKAKARAQRRVSKPKPQATITIPVAEVPEGAYCGPCVNVRLSGPQAKVLKALTFGLMNTGATLRNDRTIKNGPDTLRWMLENVKNK